MKRKFKILIAIMAVTALGVTAAGCSAKDKTEKFFEQLFCEHKYDEGVEIQAPTCSEEGVFTYTCTECGKTKKEDIPTIDHTEAEMPSMSPTCTEVGYAGGVWCEVCEFVIVEQTELAALGHFEVKDLAIAATCLQSGKTEGSHCARCHEVILAQEKISATGHKIVTVAGKPATCMETGLTDGQACENCGTVFVAQETVPVTGHIDNNGDLSCDGCGIVLFNDFTPAVGEYVLGKTYRIYPNNKYNGEEIYGYQSYFSIEVMLGDGSKEKLHVTICGEDFRSFNHHGFIFEDSFGDGYRDVTFKAGTYTAPDSNGNEITFTIDESTVIYYVQVDDSKMDYVGYVRRIEKI